MASTDQAENELPRPHPDGRLPGEIRAIEKGSGVQLQQHLPLPW